MRGKRVLSFIMALVMALSLCGNVWAEGLTTEDPVEKWLEDHIISDETTGDQWFKGVNMDRGYFTSEAAYDAAKSAVEDYEKLSSEQKEAIAKATNGLGEEDVAFWISEFEKWTQLPYYGLLKGVTDQTVIDYINSYVGWQGWENEYNTFFFGMWKNGTYQPMVVESALAAYKALNATSKAVLDALTVWDGNVNGNYQKSFAAWMQLREQEYRSETNVVTRDLLDINGLTNADAKKFINDYFETDGSTYDDNGTKCLNIWGKDMVWAPDGGHMTQASYNRAVALMAAYNALSDAAKDDLDRLCVSAYDSFGMRLVYDYGDPYMAAATGTVVYDAAKHTKAAAFLSDAGMSIGADGALTINNANMVQKGDEWYFKIDYDKTGNELASMNAAKQALKAYYGRDFDGTSNDDPLWNRDRDTSNELNNLKITVNGTAMWFEHAMSWLWDVYNNTLYGGEYEEYFFRAAGYAVPELGKDFTVRVPKGLEKGVDYDYEYVTDSSDPAENGVLTIRVKAGVKDHWLEAVQNTEKVSLNAGVLFSVDFNKPNGANRFASLCGQGIDGMFAKYLSDKSEDKQELYDSGRNIAGDEKVGNGRPIASINQVGDTLTVTSSDAYGVDHMPMVWYENAKDSSSDTDNLTEVSRFMLAFRIVVEDKFSYEFNVSTRTATVENVTLDDGWEQVETLSSDLIVRPAKDSVKKTVTIKQLMPDRNIAPDKYESLNSDCWSLGTFTLTPPEGYTLDVQESRELTQDGWLWEDNDSNTANTLKLYTYGDRTSTVFYTFVWKKTGAPDIKEELTVRVTEAQSVFAGISKDGETIEAKHEEKPVVDNAVQDTPIGGMKTLYDATLGFMETMFVDLPSVEDAKKLFNGAGVTMQPPNDATHFRWTMGDGNNDLAYISQSEADEYRNGLRDAASETFALYNDQNELTHEAKDKLTFAYAAVDVLEVEGLTIYFATTQNYRYKVVEWLKKVDVADGADSAFETVGYTYIYGKNGPMVKTEKTESVTDISQVPEDEKNKAHFVCNVKVNFICSQYVQEGEANCWYFRLTVDDQGEVERESGYVYLPYSFFGDLTYEKAQQRANPPEILHYAKGDGTEPEPITGEYTEYGVKFAASSFSPFVVKLDDTPKTDDGNIDTGSDAVDSGSSTGGHEHVRRYPATVSTGNGTTDSTGATDAGNTVQSADTGDAGIMLYAALCVSSLLGMGYAGKKRH